MADAFAILSRAAEVSFSFLFLPVVRCRVRLLLLFGELLFGEPLLLLRFREAAFSGRLLLLALRCRLGAALFAATSGVGPESGATAGVVPESGV